jgi:hypothetical protein
MKRPRSEIHEIPDVAKRMDIGSLPKEVLFELLLKVDPHEISVVCHSKNRNVRAICSSKLFQETYKKKHYKLMGGNILAKYDYENRKYIFRDEIGNQIKISEERGEITSIEYIPYKQIYTSTTNSYLLKETESEIREINPMNITMIKRNDDWYIEFGRDGFANGPEIKTFLISIGKLNWWSEDYNYSPVWGSRAVLKEFYDEIVNILKNVKIDKNTFQQVFKPLNL